MEKTVGPAPGIRPGPTGAQSRVLDALAQRDAPTTLVQLAEITGLHANTLRGHLDALHRAGHVSRLRATPTGRGRPAWTYLVREAPYATLTRALARGLEASPGGTAREVGTAGGRAWGVQLRAQLEEADQTDRERLLRALEHVGFGPEDAAQSGSVRLTRCPFLDAARAHPEAVCSVHLGLIEGALGESPDRATLQPFAEPGACLVTLAAPVTQQ